LPTFCPLAEDGLLGVWFLPPGDGPHPAVIVLGGSEGGLPVAFCRAAVGLAWLRDTRVGYLGLPGLSCGLVNIPLEYFGRAIAHVRAAVASMHSVARRRARTRPRWPPGGERSIFLRKLKRSSRPGDPARSEIAYQYRGVAYQAKADYDRAISDFDQAIQLAPKSTRVNRRTCCRLY
jgi:tetratricopeptide (TPR) repeat protein